MKCYKRGRKSNVLEDKKVRSEGVLQMNQELPIYRNKFLLLNDITICQNVKVLGLRKREQIAGQDKDFRSLIKEDMKFNHGRTIGNNN